MANKIVANLIILALFVPSVFAESGQLMLDKLSLSHNISLGDSACDELMYIGSGKDIPDMHIFPCYGGTGRYIMTLFGPTGTTVTLFGKQSFGLERGYLIIKKKDDKAVWILNLEGFPHRQWFDAIATKESGAFEAFYDSAPIFEQNVSSVKWNTWWSGDPGLPAKN